MFIRLHKPPKVKGSEAKIAYYHGRSHLRYLKTPDGKYIDTLSRSILRSGTVSNVSFVESV